jgi:glycosyltransferase involved in cell wall biosynthesis
VFDFDDAIMWTPRVGVQRVWSRAESCLRSVQAVDRVIAGNHLLAEWAAQYNSDVRYIPSCVETSEYRQKQSFETEAVPRLVWMGSPSTEPYVASVAEELLKVHAATGARLVLISAGNATLGAVDRMIDRVDWSPDVAAGIGDWDVAIAPLVDGPMERGKCAYKVLQYAAAGLPAVVSPVGANKTVAADLGYPAPEDPQAWGDALVDVLRASPSERASMGAAARTAVDAGYSYAAWSADWLRAVGEE